MSSRNKIQARWLAALLVNTESYAIDNPNTDYPGMSRPSDDLNYPRLHTCGVIIQFGSQYIEPNSTLFAVLFADLLDLPPLALDDFLCSHQALLSDHRRWIGLQAMDYAFTRSPAELLSEFGVSEETGLSQPQVLRSREKHGSNGKPYQMPTSLPLEDGEQHINKLHCLSLS